MSFFQVDKSNASIQTTNATQTTLFSYTLPDNSVGLVQAVICAIDISGNSKVWEISVPTKNPSGTASVVGSTVSLVTQSDVGAITWSTTASASGNTILIKVTGALLTTINWGAIVDINGYIVD